MQRSLVGCFRVEAAGGEGDAVLRALGRVPGALDALLCVMEVDGRVVLDFASASAQAASAAALGAGAEAYRPPGEEDWLAHFFGVDAGRFRALAEAREVVSEWRARTGAGGARAGQLVRESARVMAALAACATVAGASSAEVAAANPASAYATASPGERPDTVVLRGLHVRALGFSLRERRGQLVYSGWDPRGWSVDVGAEDLARCERSVRPLLERFGRLTNLAVSLEPALARDRRPARLPSAVASADEWLATVHAQFTRYEGFCAAMGALSGRAWGCCGAVLVRKPADWAGAGAGGGGGGGGGGALRDVQESAGKLDPEERRAGETSQFAQRLLATRTSSVLVDFDREAYFSPAARERRRQLHAQDLIAVRVVQSAERHAAWRHAARRRVRVSTQLRRVAEAVAVYDEGLQTSVPGLAWEVYHTAHHERGFFSAAECGGPEALARIEAAGAALEQAEEAEAEAAAAAAPVAVLARCRVLQRVADRGRVSAERVWASVRARRDVPARVPELLWTANEALGRALGALWVAGVDPLPELGVAAREPAQGLEKSVQEAERASAAFRDEMLRHRARDLEQRRRGSQLLSLRALLLSVGAHAFLRFLDSAGVEPDSHLRGKTLFVPVDEAFLHTDAPPPISALSDPHLLLPAEQSYAQALWQAAADRERRDAAALAFVREHEGAQLRRVRAATRERFPAVARPPDAPPPVPPLTGARAREHIQGAVEQQMRSVTQFEDLVDAIRVARGTALRMEDHALHAHTRLLHWNQSQGLHVAAERDSVLERIRAFQRSRRGVAHGRGDEGDVLEQRHGAAELQHRHRVSELQDHQQHVSDAPEQLRHPMSQQHSHQHVSDAPEQLRHPMSQQHSHQHVSDELEHHRHPILQHHVSGRLLDVSDMVSSAQKKSVRPSADVDGLEQARGRLLEALAAQDPDPESRTLPGGGSAFLARVRRRAQEALERSRQGSAVPVLPLSTQDARQWMTGEDDLVASGRSSWRSDEASMPAYAPSASPRGVLGMTGLFVPRSGGAEADRPYVLPGRDPSDADAKSDRVDSDTAGSRQGDDLEEGEGGGGEELEGGEHDEMRGDGEVEEKHDGDVMRGDGGMEEKHDGDAMREDGEVEEKHDGDVMRGDGGMEEKHDGDVLQDVRIDVGAHASSLVSPTAPPPSPTVASLGTSMPRTVHEPSIWSEESLAMHCLGGQYDIEEMLVVRNGRVPSEDGRLDLCVRVGVDGQYYVSAEPLLEGLDGLRSSTRSAAHFLGPVRSRARRPPPPSRAPEQRTAARAAPALFLAGSLSLLPPGNRPSKDTLRAMQREACEADRPEALRARVLKANLHARGGTTVHLINRVLAPVS